MIPAEVIAYIEAVLRSGQSGRIELSVKDGRIVGHTTMVKLRETTPAR